MKLTNEERSRVIRSASIPNRGAAPPRAVLQALVSLVPNDQEIKATICAVKNGQDRITWRLLSVTKDAVIFVEASRVSKDWWMLNPKDEQPAEHLDAWIKPLRDVRRVGVVETESRDDDFYQEEWRWVTAHNVTFKDDMTVLVPPFGGLPSAQEQDAVEGFIGSVLHGLIGIENRP